MKSRRPNAAPRVVVAAVAAADRRGKYEWAPIAPLDAGSCVEAYGNPLCHPKPAGFICRYAPGGTWRLAFLGTSGGLAGSPVGVALLLHCRDGVAFGVTFLGISVLYIASRIDNKAWASTLRTLC